MLRSSSDDTIADAATVDDMIFEDAATSHGAGERATGDETADYSEDGERSTKGGDVRAFLDDQEQAKVDSKPAAEKKPVVPTWTIRVYDGGELREEKVELPKEPVSENTSGGQPGQGSGKSWKGWLSNTFLRGASRTANHR